MDWNQVYTIIGVNIGLAGIIATVVIWAISRIDSDVKKINIDVKSIGMRMDAFERRMDAHASRIDQLYKMFVDLVKKEEKK